MQTPEARVVWYLVSRQAPEECKFPIVRPEQTNQRAELLACIVALQSESRAIELRTDSMYVLGGIACSQSVLRGDNADLWRVLRTELARRGNIDQFVKVKGHSKDCDVSAGKVLPIDKWETMGLMH